MGNNGEIDSSFAQEITPSKETAMIWIADRDPTIQELHYDFRSSIFLVYSGRFVIRNETDVFINRFYMQVVRPGLKIIRTDKITKKKTRILPPKMGWVNFINGEFVWAPLPNEAAYISPEEVLEQIPKADWGEIPRSVPHGVFDQ